MPLGSRAAHTFLACLVFSNGQTLNSRTAGSDLGVEVGEIKLGVVVTVVVVPGRNNMARPMNRGNNHKDHQQLQADPGIGTML